MTRKLLSLACALLLAASSVLAQTARDGTDALARGDVQTAVSVLQPLVESWPSPNPLLDFIMAALYENGNGVPVDRLRACALYLRASSSDNSRLFSESGFILSGSLREMLGDDEFRRCVLLVSTGLGHQFQPVTFTLEPGHWITLELDTAAITYQWKETKHELDLAITGIIFLPPKHTELPASGAPPGRRHFIEVFSWIPDQQAQTWTLLWRVFEVVRDRLDRVTQADLGSISAERPPTGPTFDPSRMARLRVNDEARAMWEVLEGPERGSDIIETAAEKEEALERARARKAEDRVDWDVVRDVKRPPSLVYPAQGGCAHIALYGWSDDRTEAIYVRADKEILGLSETPKTFDLSSKASALELVVHVYQRAIRNAPYCTDLIMPVGPVETWRVVSGRATITLATGARVRLPGPVTLSAMVGMVWG